MSWNTAKKRFQKDIESYPKALRDVYLRKANKFALPTFETKEWPLPKAERKSKLEQIGFASGDLAYITKGEKKGTISTIFQYSPEMNSFLLADVTSKRVLPKLNWVEHQTSHIIDYPDYVKLEDVKLAAKDKDDEGKVYYVVADEIVYGEKYYDERYKQWLPRRFVSHHKSIEIPWPNPPLEPKDDYLSTTEDVAHERTYELQTIARSPLPKGVLSELRNPYSKYKKTFLTEQQIRKVNAPDMPMSAAQKAYLARKLEEPEKTHQGLTAEMEEYIGQRIADHLNKIENPHLLAHIEAISKVPNPDLTEKLLVEEMKETKHPHD